MIPGSTLLAYVDADHWAIGANLQASPSAIVRAAAGNEVFPRRALLEAVLRTIVEDMAGAPGSPSPQGQDAHHAAGHPAASSTKTLRGPVAGPRSHSIDCEHVSCTARPR